MTTWTADRLMATEFPEMRWAVDGVLAEGVNVLAGAPKFGKSWMALGLAVAVASGGRAFGRIPVDQGEVLYLALEDTGRRLQDRLRKVLRDQLAPSTLTFSTEWCGIEAVGAWLDAHPAARLVVVDVLQRVRPPQLRGESGYSTDYRALEPFVELAGKHRVCILVIHHTRKAGDDDFVAEMSGTFGLSGAADAILVARRSRQSGAAILRLTGRDVEERELALDFDPHTGCWTLLDGPAVLHDVSDTRRRIFEALESTDGLTPTEVAAKSQLDFELVKKTLQRMASDDQLERRQGRYSTPVPLSLLSPCPPGDPRDSGDSPPQDTA